VCSKGAGRSLTRRGSELHPQAPCIVKWQQEEGAIFYIDIFFLANFVIEIVATLASRKVWSEQRWCLIQGVVYLEGFRPVLLLL